MQQQLMSRHPSHPYLGREESGVRPLEDDPARQEGPEAALCVDDGDRRTDQVTCPWPCTAYRRAADYPAMSERPSEDENH
jgi:hypothetical protein